MDFSFKYIQKRNIRKEKHHQNQTQYSLKHHPYPDFGSHRVYSQSSRNAFAGSLRSPSQALYHARPRSPIPWPIPSCSKSPYGVSVPHPCASISKESYPPTPFPFSATGHHHNRQSQKQYFPLPPCPISHRRCRIDIKAQKRANGIIPHSIPHLDYKT